VLKDEKLEANKSNVLRLRQNTLKKISKQIRRKSAKEGMQNIKDDEMEDIFKHESFSKQLKSVISNSAFVCLCLSLTGLYYVVTGIQYWTPDYLKNVLKVSDHTISIYFSTTSLTAPVSGVFVGGLVTSAWGGYTNPRSMKLQVLMGLGAIACALPIPWLSSFYVVGILFWGLLFFGGFILPPITGIMINSVGEYQKSSANSIANLCYNLLGYLPAPQIYGLVSQWTGGSLSRWPMGVTLYSTILSVSLLFFGIKIMLRRQEEEIERRGSTMLQKNNYNKHEEEEEALIKEEDSKFQPIDNSKRL
jgi:sugar phosphate permease